MGFAAVVGFGVVLVYWCLLHSALSMTVEILRQVLMMNWATDWAKMVAQCSGMQRKLEQTASHAAGCFGGKPAAAVVAAVFVDDVARVDTAVAVAVKLMTCLASMQPSLMSLLKS